MKPPFKLVRHPRPKTDLFARISVRYGKTGCTYRGVVVSCPARNMRARFKTGRLLNDLDAALALCRQSAWEPVVTQSLVRYLPLGVLHERGLVEIEDGDRPVDAVAPKP